MKCIKKVKLFENDKPKNRLLTAKEREDEKLTAAIWKRPQRHYLYDVPTYPYCPICPLVNFDLKYKE